MFILQVLTELRFYTDFLSSRCDVWEKAQKRSQVKMMICLIALIIDNTSLVIATKLYNFLFSKLYIYSVTDIAYDTDIGKFSNMICIVHTYLNFQMALISVKEKLWLFICCS